MTYWTWTGIPNHFCYAFKNAIPVIQHEKRSTSTKVCAVVWTIIIHAVSARCTCIYL